ncbi:MAG: hypothetical protein KAX49_11525 [Halanaerobiales bacterium]|nr:hypothetical protein [Halanaerobiales bacterium]
MEEKIQDKEKILQEVRSEEEIFAQLKGKVEAFYRRYTEKEIASLNEEIEQLNQKKKELDQKIEEGINRRDHLKNEDESQRIILEETRTLLLNEEKIIEKLQGFVTLYQMYIPKKEEENQLERKISQIRAQIKRWDEENRKNIQKVADKKQEIKETNKQKEAHKEDYRNYGLEVIESFINTSDSYEMVRQNVDTINSRLYIKQTDWANIQTLLNKFQKEYDDALRYIKEIEIESDWLFEHHHKVTWEEIIHAKKLTFDQQQECQKQKEYWDQIKIDVGSTERVWEDSANDIEKKFERSPAEYSSVLYEDEYKDVCRQIKQLKDRRKMLAQKMKSSRDWQNETNQTYELISHRLDIELERIWNDVISLSNYS